jgi:predicted nuclease of restriction endonuclease-like (RecB) superfamily
MSNKKKPSNPGTEKPNDTRLSRGRTRPDAIFPVPPSAASLPESYAATLREIKNHLRGARIRAVLAANPIVIEAYWHTGKIILARQEEAAWGAKVIDRLAADLKQEFPNMGGLSVRNLLAMKVFAREFPDGPIAQQPVAYLPWGHVLQIMQRAKDPAARDFYIRETLAHGWPNMPCVAWINPLPSPLGRPSLPKPCPRNSAAASPASRKSKPSWRAI